MRIFVVFFLCSFLLSGCISPDPEPGANHIGGDDSKMAPVGSILQSGITTETSFDITASLTKSDLIFLEILAKMPTTIEIRVIFDNLTGSPYVAGEAHPRETMLYAANESASFVSLSTFQLPSASLANGLIVNPWLENDLISMQNILHFTPTNVTEGISSYNFGLSDAAFWLAGDGAAELRISASSPVSAYTSEAGSFSVFSEPVHFDEAEGFGAENYMDYSLQTSGEASNMILFLGADGGFSGSVSDKNFAQPAGNSSLRVMKYNFTSNWQLEIPDFRNSSENSFTLAVGLADFIEGRKSF